MSDTNPLLNDRDVRFLLFQVFEAERLCKLPYFEDHSRETFELFLASAAKLAREAFFPAYKPMDESPAHFSEGRVHAHPVMRELWPQLVELGLVNAGRPYDVGGQQLPMTVGSLAAAYVMAANLSAFGFSGLTSGAAHLIEAFGSDELKATYMEKMYGGEWSGTMALTEPQAGSNLADVQTRARPTDAGHYLLDGSKVFISGGDQTFTENIVHLVLARIEGAPPGIKGVSLFAVPRLRVEGDGLVPNDAVATGTFHKMGYRGIPSIALSFGEQGDCHGYLVGEPHRGIRYMFQMMNEARINVGIQGVATAYVAYLESLEYARNRPQGRAPGVGVSEPQSSILVHADVRRMLLRQKAIVEGGLCLCVATSRYADLAEHSEDAAERERCQRLLDLLTPVAKTFPAELGFEANCLSVQVLGGYGYTSEYLPESWLRDQKLNSIHEGTTGIQGMDLLGRKVLGTGGASMQALDEAVGTTLAAAVEAGVDGSLCEAFASARKRLRTLTLQLLQTAAQDPARAVLHSNDFLQLMGIFIVGWQWLQMATVAQRALPDAGVDRDFYEGKLCAARYWCHTELPRIDSLATLCETAEDSYARMQDEWF